MLNDAEILDEIPGLYRIIPLNLFRKTPGVIFDNVPVKAFPQIGAIDNGAGYICVGQRGGDQVGVDELSAGKVCVCELGGLE